MTIMELREKRNKALDAAKAFLESHRTDKGVLSIEDDATYTKMEADIDALTNEIHRLERQEQREADMNMPINTPLTSKPSGNMAHDKKTGRASDAYKEGMLTALRTNFRQVSNILQEGVDADGGYLVPEEYDSRLIRVLEGENIMRRYSDVEIEWCSTEHQCSTLQALEGLSLVLNDKKYKEAAELVRDQLFLKCYDESNGRFYQGINGGKPDKAWALDCTTWAGSLIFSVVHTDTAKKCFHTARDVYLTENKQIIQSGDKEHYNMRYSSPELFAGFKPYSDKTPDYEGAPDIVWTEGTLGYAALALCVGEEEEAKKYVDECIVLQNCEGCTGGVIYVTETYASLPWEFHVWESVVSSAWLYLIINNPDVLFPRTLRQVYYMVKTYNIKDERP